MFIVRVIFVCATQLNRPCSLLDGVSDLVQHMVLFVCDRFHYTQIPKVPPHKYNLRRIHQLRSTGGVQSVCTKATQALYMRLCVANLIWN